MEIIKVKPQGFCKGVLCAIKLINDVLDQNTYKPPLYMLGELVHNKHITDAYINKGIKIINDYHDIDCGTIIVTAHGLSNQKKQEILARGLDLIDATCMEVLKIQDFIKDVILKDYDVIYYGKTNHPESSAILSISDKIHFITNKSDINKLNITNKKLVFTNQTTMSYFDTLEIIDALRLKYPHLSVNIDICNSSKMRQLSLLDNKNNCDICVVVGDKNSNNTLSLKKICEEMGKVTYLIENVDEACNFAFSSNDRILVTAGASTPNKLVDEVINKILDSSYVSKCSNEDYIKL